MEPKKHISLLQLQKLVRKRLEESFPLACWVTAEISELKVNYSGHCYMELVEKGGGNQVPCAKVNAVIWRSTFGALDSYFLSATGSRLSGGMAVLLKVSVTYHELYGLSLSVSDIDPLYTLGDMERQRQQTIGQLQEEGVFDMNRSLELPMVIQSVAVISSRNAAGYQDFMNEIAACGYRFSIELFDSFMQGHATEQSVIDSLERVAAADTDFDAVVIIRGGGSQSDLAAFDSYRLCSHIAQFPLPVITGIGHDKDESVADMVSAVALKTPTAVAAWLVAGMNEFDDWLAELTYRLTETVVSMLDGEKRRLRMAGLELSKATTVFARDVQLRIDRLRTRIDYRARTVISGCTEHTENMSRQVGLSACGRIAKEKQTLDMLNRVAESHRTEKILALGFAIVRSGGSVVKDSGDIDHGSLLDITLAWGSIEAKVNSKNNG